MKSEKAGAIANTPAAIERSPAITQPAPKAALGFTSAPCAP